MNAVERLNTIFNDRNFLEINKDLDNFESVYAAVTVRDSEITRDELQDYLVHISEKMHGQDAELSEDQLEEVAGGAAWEIILGCYGLGYGLGNFIYNITHR